METGNWQSLDELGLTPGVSWLYSNVKVTKKQIEGFNVAAKWKKKFKGCAPMKAGLFLQILVTFPLLSKPIENALTLKKCSEILRVAAIFRGY